MGNVRRVSPEVEREVLGLWNSQAQVMARHARPAIAHGGPLPIVRTPYTPVSQRAALARREAEEAALRSKVKTLYDHGVEVKYIAERFSLSPMRVRQWLGLTTYDGGWDD